MIDSYLGELLAAAALVLFSSNIILTKVASVRLGLDTGFLISVSVNVIFCLMLVCVELWVRKEGPGWDAYGFCI
ncbi:MAG: EamA family transporter, partial [Paralcaligenes sp.]